MINFISGEKLQKLAHYIVDENGGRQVREISKEDYPVVYSHTHHVKYLVPWCRENMGSIPYNILTHNSDEKLDAEKFDDELPGLNLWFAQNVDYNHPKLISVPIGLENSYCFDYNKAEMLFNTKIKQKSTTKLFYLNVNINTNPTERLHLYDICRRFLNPEFITIENGKNGDDYQHYLDQVASHQFVLSPPGNGLDCHRTWEALYLSSVPICVANINNINLLAYTNMIVVNNWEELINRISWVYYPPFKNFLTMEYMEKVICRK